MYGKTKMAMSKNAMKKSKVKKPTKVKAKTKIKTKKIGY
jgi:hypothetical protein|tara:strand:- start:477 stop:593 length:117 start_codon:yes stop_codon:yes gene_type:complete